MPYSLRLMPTPPHAAEQTPRLQVISPVPSTAPAGEAELVARLRRGDPEASREVWDRYYQLVRGLLSRYSGPKHDVDDQVQEVFMRLFRRVDALRDEGALRSYIVGITMRVIRSEMRKHAIRNRLWWDYTQRVGYEQAALGSSTEEVQRLAGILDRVSDRVRFVFLMRYVEELSLPEIADALHVSLATAKRRVRSATDVVLKQAKADPVLERYLYESQRQVVADVDADIDSDIEDFMEEAEADELPPEPAPMRRRPPPPPPRAGRGPADQAKPEIKSGPRSLGPNSILNFKDRR